MAAKVEEAEGEERAAVGRSQRLWTGNVMQRWPHWRVLAVAVAVVVLECPAQA